MEYIRSASSSPDYTGFSVELNEISALLEAKLWHQLAQKLQHLFKQTQLQQKQKLLNLYTNFIEVNYLHHHHSYHHHHHHHHYHHHHHHHHRLLLYEENRRELEPFHGCAACCSFIWTMQRFGEFNIDPIII